MAAVAAAGQEGGEAQEGEEYEVARGLSESDFYSQYWERDADETSADMQEFVSKEGHLYRIHPKFMCDVVQAHGSPHSLIPAWMEIEGFFPL